LIKALILKLAIKYWAY